MQSPPSPPPRGPCSQALKQMATQFRQMDTPSFPRLMIFGYYTASHFFREIEPGFLRQRRRQEISFKGEKQFRFSYPVFWRTKNKKSLSQASPLSQAVFATKPARKSPTSQGQKTNRERALPPHCTGCFFKKESLFCQSLDTKQRRSSANFIIFRQIFIIFRPLDVAQNHHKPIFE